MPVRDWAYAILALVALQRLIELFVAERNTRALRARGAIIAHVRRREQLERLITVTVATALPVLGYGWIQYRAIDPLPWAGNTAARVASTMGNSIFVAAYLILVLPFVLYRLTMSLVGLRKPEAEETAAPGNIAVDIAWLLAAYVTDAEVRLIVGAIGLSFVTYSFLRRKPKPHKRSALTGTFWGALSGFTTFMAQAGGPPLQVHILPQRMAKLKLVGTTTIFYAVVNSLKIVPYFSLGQFTSKNFVTSLMLVPLAFASNFFGIWLVERTPEDTFYRIAYLLVLLISIALVWQGANGMLHG